MSTIHGVKGDQFRNVFIINCVEGTIPHSNNDNLEEERRLFYVGITRTMDNLYLFSPKNRKGQTNDISRFILEGKLNRMPVETYGYEVSNKILHKLYGIGEIEELKQDKIVISFDNNIRSFSIKVLIDNNLIEKI